MKQAKKITKHYCPDCLKDLGTPNDDGTFYCICSGGHWLSEGKEYVWVADNHVGSGKDE